ncbi:MAG TPA: dihydropteroate synthase [Kofleriaceae bacterium]
MTVREARPEEWREWRELRLRALADSPDAFGETLASAKKADDAMWQSFVAPRADKIRLFAEQGGKPAGMCVIVIGRGEALGQGPGDSRKANLYAMWVAPEARGTGAGKALVEAGLRWARSRAALEVELRVSDLHEPARRLYERCGFVDTGERSPLRPGSEVQSSSLVARLSPLIMGVVNVTPDSFSDGGVYLDPAKAIAHGEQLLADGADILDIGGEATNPRAQAVTVTEELRRVLPVIERLAASVYGRDWIAPPAISIDTTKAEVARAAVAAGATIINDVSGGLFDPEMAAVVGELGENVTYIAGHLRGRSLPDVFTVEASVSWQTVAAELAERLGQVAPQRAWIDPGIGFGKGADPEGNVALLRHAGDIASTIRRPIVVGPSRKRFLRKLLPDAAKADPLALDVASVAACLGAVRAGALVVRVHNVALLRTALAVYTKL